MSSTFKKMNRAKISPRRASHVFSVIRSDLLVPFHFPTVVVSS